MSQLTRCILLVGVLLSMAHRAAAGTLLIDNFLTNGVVTQPSLGLESAGAMGPTNKFFTALGTNAIGNRTTILEAVSPGVPVGGYAYVEPTGAGTALFYNSGLAGGQYSTHSILWSAGNFDLLTAVGVSSPDQMFFRLDFGENNFPLTATQPFEVSVSSAGGSALYSAIVNSNDLAASTNFSVFLNHQSGTFNEIDVSILLKANLAFAGGNNQVVFSGVSVVPEPS
ncbi:MAG: hypothetical protein KGQ89_11555, partial [Verrucomicrobia bacterium]|nr:hypothetical protein [Verrucomicrobiota bacterium]